MIAIIKKNSLFYLTPKCQKSFNLLKKRFIIAPVLAHFDFEKECILETNLSNNASARMFCQYGEDRLLHPMAFFSCKYLSQVINYEIYDKKLLAIIRSFEPWRLILENAGLSI